VVIFHQVSGGHAAEPTTSCHPHVIAVVASEVFGRKRRPAATSKRRLALADAAM